MKQATRYIFKAIGIELFLTILTLEIFSYLIFQDIQFFPPTHVVAGIIALVPSLVSGYLLGEKVAYAWLPKINRFFLGIVFIFTFLVISVCVGNFALELMYRKEWLSLEELLEVLLIFFLFGGIQTLGVGIWLGIKLSHIRKN